MTVRTVVLGRHSLILDFLLAAVLLLQVFIHCLELNLLARTVVLFVRISHFVVRGGMLLKRDPG